MPNRITHPDLTQIVVASDVAAELRLVWRFCADLRNERQLLPESWHLEFTRTPFDSGGDQVVPRRGQEWCFQLRRHGLSRAFRIELVKVLLGDHVVYRAHRSPFDSWEWFRYFQMVRGGTRITEVLQYRPCGRWGRFRDEHGGRVRTERLIRYRHERLLDLFGHAAAPGGAAEDSGQDAALHAGGAA